MGGISGPRTPSMSRCRTFAHARTAQRRGPWPPDSRAEKSVSPTKRSLLQHGPRHGPRRSSSVQPVVIGRFSRRWAGGMKLMRISDHGEREDRAIVNGQIGHREREDRPS